MNIYTKWGGGDCYDKEMKTLVPLYNKCLDRHGDYIKNGSYLKLRNRIFCQFLAVVFRFKKKIGVVTSGVPVVSRVLQVFESAIWGKVVHRLI